MTWFERLLLWVLLIATPVAGWLFYLETLSLRGQNRDLARALGELHADHRQMVEDMKKLAAQTESRLQSMSTRIDESAARTAEVKARIGSARVTHEPKTNAVVWDWDGS